MKYLVILRLIVSEKKKKKKYFYVNKHMLCFLMHQLMRGWVGGGVVKCKDLRRERKKCFI